MHEVRNDVALREKLGNGFSRLFSATSLPYRAAHRAAFADKL
jgi:hypothetical protein